MVTFAGLAMQRKLTTILAADIAGYTRLVAQDEEGTISRLSNMQLDLIEPTFKSADGHIFKTMGDGFLAEFASAVSALRAALQIQDIIKEQQADIPSEKRFELRVGIHLGDVVVRHNDLFGDAVNIAARLESIAPAGGICVSRSVVEQSSKIVSADFVPLGAKALKNLPNPIDVWSVSSSKRARSAGTGAGTDARVRLMIGEFIASTAVPEIKALGTGVSEDVAGALSRTIIVLRYDPKTEESVILAAQRAKATHILEGSLRVSGDRVRLSATLLTSNNGQVSWTRRFEGTVNDLFDLQDNLAIAIAQEIGAELFDETFGLTLRAEGTRNLEAWRCYSEALPDLRDPFDQARRERARTSLDKALSLDPNFVAAWAAKTNVSYADFRTTGRVGAIEEAHRASDRALAIAPDSATAWSAKSRAHLMDRQHEEALAAAEEATRRAPEEVAFAVNYAMLLDRADQSEKALVVAHRAAKLDPRATLGRLGQVQGLALLSLGRNEEAATIFRNVASSAEEWSWTRLYLAVAQHLAGQADDAAQSYMLFREAAQDFDVLIWDNSQLHKSESVRARRGEAARYLEEQNRSMQAELRR